MGTAIATTLLEAGAEVLLVDRDREQLEAVVAALSSEAVASYPCDLTSESQVRSLVAHAGAVHGLVNAQGIAPFNGLANTTLDEWQAVLDANLTSVFLTCRGFGAVMSAAGAGSIVNFSSTAGSFGVPEMSAYTAAKHGVIGFTRAIAIELARRNVRVNCVCPGATLTPMLLATPEEYRAARIRRVPLGRLAEPNDQARATAFLLSDDSAYITGACIPVDGGMSALAPGTAERDIRGEAQS
jgi:meso-butanediol dehydrogenase/(S,S)-butanediol dehydrogenase/diacetyl reductase